MHVSKRVLGQSVVLTLLVLLAYSVVQTPVLLLRSAMIRSVPANEVTTILLGTFFVSLNVPLSLFFAWAISEGRRRKLAIAAWAIAMFALQFVAVYVQNLVQRTFWPDAVFISFRSLYPTAIVLDSATAVGLLIAVIALLQQDAARKAALRADQLRALARQEELDALLAQLHPHFLFNTLNAIAALIRTDPVAARSTLAQLRTLIEQHIESAPSVWTVADEMEVVSTYLQIEKRRFGDRLEFALDIDRDSRDTAFPRLLLQPLVENAVRHGARSGGSVSVSVERENGELHAEVRDSGRFPANDAGGTGIGLKNVRARLELMYGAKHRLDIASGEAGTSVRLTLPA
jgi:sensor histidine kinase YesM